MKYIIIIYCPVSRHFKILTVSMFSGRMIFKRPDIQNQMVSNKLIPIRYVDDDGSPTEVYPLNPNGSPLGIAGICSEDGRHLAIMPHPERCVWAWQCPWMPSKFRSHLRCSPWMTLFKNAFNWCANIVY